MSYIDDMGAKLLAAEVLKQAAKDIKTQQSTMTKTAEREVLAGGVDLYLDILNVDMGHDTFIRRSRERGK